MVRFEESVDSIKSLGVEIPFAALIADFRFHVLNDVQLTLKPVLFLYGLLRRVSTTEFTNHCAPRTIYTVMIIRLPTSLNLHTT